MNPYPPELRAAVVSDYEAGMTCDEIATARDLGASTVHNWIRAAGVAIRPAAPRAPRVVAPRTCSVDGCNGKHQARGYCNRHYGRYILGRQPRSAWLAFDPQDRIEDCRWMAQHGETLTGAAKRLGVTRSALDRWLRKYDPTTLRTLADREQWPDESRATFHGQVSA